MCNGNAFKLKEVQFRQDIWKNFYSEAGQILEQVVQRDGTWSIAENISSQVGQGPEQHDLVEHVAAHSRGVWPR